MGHSDMALVDCRTGCQISANLNETMWKFKCGRVLILWALKFVNVRSCRKRNVCDGLGICICNFCGIVFNVTWNSEWPSNGFEMSGRWLLVSDGSLCRAIILHLLRCFEAENPNVLQLCKVKLHSWKWISKVRDLIWKRARAKGLCSVTPQCHPGHWREPPGCSRSPPQSQMSFSDVLESLTPRVCVQRAGGCSVCLCMGMHGLSPQTCVCPWELWPQADVVFAGSPAQLAQCMPGGCVRVAQQRGQGWQRAGLLFWWLVSPSPSSPPHI